MSKYPDSKRPTKVELAAMKWPELLERFLRDGRWRSLYEAEILMRIGSGSFYGRLEYDIRMALQSAGVVQSPDPKVVKLVRRPSRPFPFIKFRTDDAYDVGEECEIFWEYLGVIEEKLGWPGGRQKARAYLARIRNGTSYGALSAEDRRYLHSLRDVAQKFYHVDNETSQKSRAHSHRDAS